MIKFSKASKFLSSILASAVCAISLPAAAAQTALNMPMSLNLTITETLAPLSGDPTRCPADTSAMAIGMLAGTGVMTVATGPGTKVASIPVIFAGSDCPSVNFSFLNGKFTLLTPSGNQMYVDYHGGFRPTSPTTLVMDAGSAFTISGGTGSLAGASGTGTLTGNENILSQPPAFLGFGSIQANGTISFSSSSFAQRFMNGQ